MMKKQSMWRAIRTYRFSRLWLFNFLLVLLLIALPLSGVTFFYFCDMNREMERQIKSSNEELLEKSAVALDSVVSNITYLSNHLLKKEATWAFFDRQEEESPEWETVRDLVALLQDTESLFPYVESVRLVSRGAGDVLGRRGMLSKEEYSGKSWYQICRAYPYERHFSVVLDNDTIFYCTPLYYQEETRGMVAVTLNMRDMVDSFFQGELDKAHKLFVMDVSGRIIYCSDPNPIYFDEVRRYEISALIRSATEQGTAISPFQGGQAVISVEDSHHYSWCYALVSEMRGYAAEQETLRHFLTVSVFTGLAASVLAGILITYVTYRPVKKILNVLRGTEPEEEAVSRRENELLYIISHILNTVTNRQRMEQELQERVSHLKKVQVLALQLQINPHFLYNTLDTIKWMTVREEGMDNPSAVMLEKLAELYRMTLASDDIVLPLSEEIACLSLYIQILQVRHSGRIQFVWEVEEALLGCRVLKFCLQPLVENAVQHGLRPRAYRGSVTIAARRQGEVLVLSVTDDGVGIKTEKLQSIERELETGLSPTGRHIGLKNVHERICLLYGGGYGVRVRSRPDGLEGTKVELRLPLDLPSLLPQGRDSSSDSRTGENGGTAADDSNRFSSNLTDV